jgi:hypothetical protein
VSGNIQSKEKNEHGDAVHCPCLDDQVLRRASAIVVHCDSTESEPRDNVFSSLKRENKRLTSGAGQGASFMD